MLSREVNHGGLLNLEFPGKRLKRFPVSRRIRIVEKAIVAMPIIHPTGVIKDRINTNPFDGYSMVQRAAYFGRNIGEPTRPCFVFDSSFRDEYGALISLIKFRNNFTKRPITRVKGVPGSPL